MQRVTITLPEAVVLEVDREARNRSRFVLEAIRRELRHRRQEALRRSLENPHEEACALADAGFDEWASSLPDESVAEIVHLEGGEPVRWNPGSGWQTNES